MLRTRPTGHAATVVLLALAPAPPAAGGAAQPVRPLAYIEPDNP